MNMHPDSEKLWLHIRPIIENFAIKITHAHSGLKHSIEAYANDAFFISAGVSFYMHNHGDEFALSVTAQRNKQRKHQIHITSDLCYDDGRILADGPSLTFVLADFKANTTATLDNWLTQFSEFLTAQEANVLNAVREL